MANKTLSLMTFGILAILVLTAFASAVSVNPKSLAFNPFNKTITFEIDNTGGDAFNLGSQTVIIKDNQATPNQITITLDKVAIVANAKTIVTAEIGAIPSDFSLGTFSTAYTIANDITLVMNFENTPNEYKDSDDLSLDFDVSVLKGFGEDKEWYLMDEISVDVDVKADNKDLENVVVEWGLYDVENGNWVIDGEEDNFDLDKKDKETVTIEFQLDDDAIDEINTGSNNYVFYVWATAEDADDSKVKTSTFKNENIDLKFEDDLVILSNIEMVETTSCGGNIKITADAWNIGLDKQKDVTVIIYNKELGLNQKVELGDIKSLKSSDFDVTITLPEDAVAKEYDLKFSVYQDDKLYESDNDDEDPSVYTKSLKIEGSCSVAPTVSVSAILESEKAIAGKELIIKTVIGNTGSKTSTFNVELSDYTAWASLENVDKTSVILDAGESEEVLIKLKISQDSLGDKNFNVVITENGKTLTQPVSVNVEKPTGLFTGMFSGLAGDNWYLWGIGALNVLLILVIIIVAVKVTRKKE